MTRAINHINKLEQAAFVALLGPLYEHSPWAAERAFSGVPFANEGALARAFAKAVDDASLDERVDLIRAHPELAGEKLHARLLTSHSKSEQASIGLDQLGEAELAEWARLNAAYRERFGFPFVICVRLHDKDEILCAMDHRLKRSAADEQSEAIRQIHDIARLRLADLLAKLES